MQYTKYRYLYNEHVPVPTPDKLCASLRRFQMMKNGRLWSSWVPLMGSEAGVGPGFQLLWQALLALLSGYQLSI
jgi:hypothetical protein